MSKLVYGTCVDCGRERVPGQAHGDGDAVRYLAHWHRAKTIKAAVDWGPWCARKAGLKDVEPRGTLARPLPASELNLKKLDDDQLQALLERVEAEMVRRAEGEAT